MNNNNNNNNDLISLHERREQFAKANFFDSWRDLRRCLRVRTMNEMTPHIANAEPAQRLNQFRAHAGKLSGSESAFFVWQYNLMNDDPSREIGEASAFI